MPRSPLGASHDSPARARQGTPWWVLLLLIGSLAIKYTPALVANMHWAADPLHFNDDARQQVWPFLRFADSRLFRHDPVAAYYLACSPAGFKALYTYSAPFIDPRALSKLLPYVLLGIMLIPAGFAAGRLEGKWAAWAAIAFCLGSPVFLGRMMGGLPRSFAMPLYAFAAAALVSGRPLGLVAVVCFGAAFYPTVAVTGGIALAIMLLALPPRQRGSAAGWGLWRRLAVVAGTAVLSFLIVLPGQRAMRSFGPILRPSDAAEYPEVGPAGRYAWEDRAASLLSPADWSSYVRSSLSGIGGPWEPGKRLLNDPLKRLPTWILAGLGVFGYATLAVRDVRARRLLLLAAAAVVAHVVSTPLAPYLYLPSRYLTYPLAVLAAIVVPVGVATLPLRFAKVRNVESVKALTMLLLCGAYLLGYTGHHFDKVGLTRDATPQKPMLQAITALPPNALIAGWPQDLDDVPYVTAHPAFVTREMHQAFHRRYTDLMRRRAGAVFDACFAADPAPLLRLRDDFGVAYFLVNKRLYDPSNPPPTYFAPFDQQIAHARAALGSATPDVLLEIDRAAVYTDGDWILLDLNRLPFKPTATTTLPSTAPATLP